MSQFNPDKLKFIMTNILTIIFISSIINLYADNITNKQDVVFSYVDQQRQTVDLASVPESAYHKGKILIKLTTEAGRSITDDKIHTVDEDNHIITHIPMLDYLNKKYAIIEYKPLLYGLYDISPKSVANRDKHREWGFHLWFELRFEEHHNVIQIVNDYISLNEIELAEPVYKKVIIEPVEIIEIPEEDELTRWRPNDPHYLGHQWAFRNVGQTIQGRTGRAGADISAEPAWDLEKGHSAVIVAVFDNGTDFVHPDLAGNIWGDIGPQGTNTPAGDHETHISGTIAAVTNNGRGVAGIAGGSGSSDGVRIMSCNIHSSPSLNYPTAKLFATDNGAAISQNSWSYSEFNIYNDSDLSAISYFNGNAGGEVLEGGITIFAAGNRNLSGNQYPAYYSGTIAVAATCNRDQKSDFSNYGHWVDLSAPGSLIMSTATNNRYGYLSGTSMACPHASGVTALILSHAYRNNYILTRQELRSLLLNNTDNIYSFNPDYIGRLGTGRVNAYKSLMALREQYLLRPNPVSFNATPSDSTAAVLLEWQPNSEEDEVMIVWSEESQIGFPVRGTFYDIGHNLPGGGEVLYKGADNYYKHIGLYAGETYYYKAFSFTDDFVYSDGLSASATTHTLNFTLPFYEYFDGGLPYYWQIIDYIGNEQVWEVGTFDGGLVGTTGDYAFVNSNIHGPEQTQNTELVSPIINLSENSSVTLSFKHYFLSSGSSSATLFYSINGGLNWTLYNRWDDDTRNYELYRTIIPEIAGEEAVRIKWRYYGSDAYHWCIDDIELYETIYLPPVNVEAIVEQEHIFVSWDAPEGQEPISFIVFRDNGLVTPLPISDTFYYDTDVESGKTYSYYVIAIYDDDESLPSESASVRYVTIDDDELNLPINSLQANYPNPFNPKTTISFSLAKNSYTELLVYDIQGKMIKRLVTGKLSAGVHQAEWNGMNFNGDEVASGIYFYKLLSESYSASGKMLLLK